MILSLSSLTISLTLSSSIFHLSPSFSIVAIFLDIAPLIDWPVGPHIHHHQKGPDHV